MSRMILWKATTAVFIGQFVWMGFAVAQEDSTSSLAKQTQNPIADLVSVPFQNNFNFNVGPDNRVLYNLNFQPVIPASLNKDWSLISRIIVPILSQPLADGGRALGLGDTNLSFFLSPRSSGSVTWGFGPALQLPTAKDNRFGTKKWALGPTGVIVVSSGPWVYGALANNIWSLDSDDERDVNAFLIQPFINFNFGAGWAIGTSPTITADWTAEPGQRWTLPVGLAVSKVVGIGGQMLNLSGGSYVNINKPDGQSDWQLRAVVTLLFPKS